MNVYRRYPARASLALATAVLVVVIGAATAFGRGTPSQANDRSNAAGVSASQVSIGTGGATAIGVSTSASSVGYGTAMPSWCCGGGTGMVPGLTTSGQAVMQGQGQDARDTAIAAAVKDATAQANVAAGAAGIQLGAIIDMQISAMPYYYPVAQDIGGGVVSSGTPGAESTKPGMAPDYMGSVSVTITWSLG
jgi:Protein of unknown function (DUF541)